MTTLRPALVALAGFLWACGDDGGNLQGNDPPAVAQVTVEAPATTIAVGDLNVIRLAVDAPRTVGISTIRKRARRRVREAFRQACAATDSALAQDI